ncbi:MAG: hypothetical protein JST22_12210 [Bacteroidetes bacterium]|nr:hypothetical protein [Bacteroidota bacterium]
MQLDSKKVGSAILSKGFRIDNSHHHYYIYHTIDGLRTTVRTYISHGSKGGINDYLAGQMAKQCKLTKPEFMDLVNCPLTQDGYETILRERQAIADSRPE